MASSVVAAGSERPPQSARDAVSAADLARQFSRVELTDVLFTPPAQEPAPDTAEPASPISPSPATLSVHGIVRNALTGDPLPRVLVHVEGDAAAGALTDGDGKFEISGLAPGPQIFEIVKPGFLDLDRRSDGLASEDASGSSHNVVVAPEMPDLNFALAPACAIHGRIALSTGDPAQGIEVQLLRRNVQDGRGVWQAAAATRSLSDGSYRFAGLPDGEYAVYTNPALDSEPAMSFVVPGRGANVAREGYASQFYPDARDLAGAAKIHLANGEQAQANLSLTLEPFHTVTATATFADGKSAADHPGLNFSAAVTDAQGHQLPYTAFYDQSTHTVQALLPDGTYSLKLTATLRFLTRISSGFTGEVIQPSLPPVGSVEFTVAGHAISNLRVPLTTPSPASVRLTVTHSASAQPQKLAHQPAEMIVTASQAGGWIGDGITSNFARGLDSGPMDADYLPAGPYWLHARPTRPGVCVESFTAGAVNLAREPLVLGLSGAAAPLDLTVRDDCASLNLSLPAGLSIMAPGEERAFTVYVVPDFDSTAEIDPVILRPTTSATATIESLLPGDYHVYTFSTPVALEYHNRDALAALSDSARAITLAPGATASLVLEAPDK